MHLIDEVERCDYILYVLRILDRILEGITELIFVDADHEKVLPPYLGVLVELLDHGLVVQLVANDQSPVRLQQQYLAGRSQSAAAGEPIAKISPLPASPGGRSIRIVLPRLSLPLQALGHALARGDRAQ